MRHEAVDQRSGEAGFMLLEALVAVAVAGLVLSAIGAVVAVTFAGIRSTGDRVALAETGRSLLDTLPQGEALRLGTTTGMMGTTRWRIDVVPARREDAVPRLADAGLPAWSPVAISISARSPSGRSLHLDTAGLIRDDIR